MAIFLDTSFLAAYYNKTDKFHDRSVKVIKKIQNNEFGHVYTSTYVLVEFFTYLQRKISDKEYVYSLIEGWMKINKGISQIIEVDWSIFQDAVDLILDQKSQRKPLSLTDCTIVKLCQSLNISYLATFDDGFEGYIQVIN